MGRYEDILQGEFITRTAEVIDSTDPNQIGLKGIIIDETRQTVTILPVDKRPKMIPKANVSFRIADGSSEATILGKTILYRPEDRVKRLARRYRKKKNSKNKNQSNRN